MTAARSQGLAPSDIISLVGREVRVLDQRRLPTEAVTIASAETGAGWSMPSRRWRSAVRLRLASPERWVSRSPPSIPTIPTGPAPSWMMRAGRCAPLGPTAVNLPWAVDRMRALIDAHVGDIPSLAAVLSDHARQIHDDEVERCRRIGAHGRALVHRGAKVLTHCNAGALATGGYGTALGVIRAAFEADPTLRVVVDETRPLARGASHRVGTCARRDSVHVDRRATWRAP